MPNIEKSSIQDIRWGVVSRALDILNVKYDKDKHRTILEGMFKSIIHKNVEDKYGPVK